MEVQLINIEDTTNASVLEPEQIKWKPRFSMEFDTEADAYDFYNAYGGRIGFSIRREYVNKSRVTGKITSRLFVCSKEGIRVKDKRDISTRNPRAETRTGCDARMHIKYNNDKGKYFVSKFVETHNHPLIIEECTHMMPSQRRITAIQAIDVEFASDSGIAVRNAYELMGKQAGGRQSIGFTKLDQQNYIRTRRQNELQFGDKSWLMNYFQTQACEDPSFFYVVQLDNEEMITNIFWADSRMIADYGHFGDVITFDTTYKLVHGNRPFGLFLGLNHHRETVVFGAAFMYDETSDSFAWLFDTFLNTMSSKAPKTILTDQDAAMAKALTQVMPETKHHLCTWHLMQNAQKHLGPFFEGDEHIKNVISKFMSCIEEEDDFLVKWEEMLTLYGVVDNTWLDNLFGLRHRWAKAFVKNVWSAGMRSTQLSESFNARLKEYLTRQVTLPDFFNHFERLLSDKRYKEYEAEYGLLYKLPRLQRDCEILVQAGKTYTRRIFEIFQEEFLLACVSERIISCSAMDSNGHRVYKVGIHEDGVQRCVTRTVDNQLSCSCGKFEMEGIMCSHTLKVFKEVMNINELPSQYILPRWTRNARHGNLDEILAREVMVDPKLEVRRRHRILCRILTEISSIASETNEGYNDLLLKAMEWKKSAQGCSTRSSAGKEASLPPTSTGINAKGLKTKDTSKGRRRRIKSDLEKSVEKKKKAMKRKLKISKDTGASEVASGSGRRIIPSYILVNGAEIPSEIFNDHCYVPPPVMHKRQSCQQPYSPGTHFGQPMSPSNQSNIGDTCMFSSELFNTPSSYDESCAADLALGNNCYNINLDLRLSQSTFTPTSHMPIPEINRSTQQQLFKT